MNLTPALFEFPSNQFVGKPTTEQPQLEHHSHNALQPPPRPAVIQFDDDDSSSSGDDSDDDIVVIDEKKSSAPTVPQRTASLFSTPTNRVASGSQSGAQASSRPATQNSSFRIGQPYMSPAQLNPRPIQKVKPEVNIPESYDRVDHLKEKLKRLDDLEKKCKVVIQTLSTNLEDLTNKKQYWVRLASKSIGNVSTALMNDYNSKIRNFTTEIERKMARKIKASEGLTRVAANRRDTMLELANCSVPTTSLNSANSIVQNLNVSPTHWNLQDLLVKLTICHPL
ncbi:unnamed protein product [Ambrosiozyma monospora]|uniref:Unnamed protein product n=1 Tax=Ambrosiozyma monospora TaxID=43982 RepID=A0ACB5U727_AMBMO|nr:unnamed protein product [Ambrosiozyma monospora]